MHLTFAPKGILQIDDARIVYRNFSGKGSKYNREGDRNFSVVIPDQRMTLDEMRNVEGLFREAYVTDGVDGPTLMIDGTETYTYAEALQALGWNVKINPPREEGDSPFIHLPVKVKFNDRGPNIYVISGNTKRELNEGTVSMVDDIDILKVDMDIAASRYDVNGNTGISAYLRTMFVVKAVDRFADRYPDAE